MPRGGSCEEQVADVGTGDQQNETSGDEQQQQRRANVRNHLFFQRNDDGLPVLVLRNLALLAARHARQLGFRLVRRGPLRLSRPNTWTLLVWRTVRSSGLMANGTHTLGTIQGELKRGRDDPDDCVGDAVQGHGLSNRSRIRAELAPPEPVAQRQQPEDCRIRPHSEEGCDPVTAPMPRQREDPCRRSRAGDSQWCRFSSRD